MNKSRRGVVSASCRMFGFSSVGFGILFIAGSSTLARSFVHWETPPVHPLAMTPDGGKLLLANLPDNRIEVFNIGVSGLGHVGSVYTGLDPVSVRARTNQEAWVANHVSDSISIVDLTTLRVMNTIRVGDEPADIVFAGSPQRAFVAMSQLNEVWVFDPANPTAVPTVVPIQGEDPRALATDGHRVYAAVFESGNGSTILSEFEVSAVGPYAGQNPPPNSGLNFVPPIDPMLPAPPTVGLIVRKDSSGIWRDDNTADWSPWLGWDLHDHDVAIIDANNLNVSYAARLMNLNMAIAVRPTVAGGEVTVIGTDGINEVRFEPNLQGVFIRALMGRFDPLNPMQKTVSDLNPHLDYSTPSIPLPMREQSIGDPRGIAWDATGSRGYITGMGSNNVVVIDATGVRVTTIEVGEGPTGIVVDDARGRVYVQNRFEGSISIIDTATLQEVHRVSYFDPTPDVVKVGRPHLYDTHKSSGLGQASCASCHPDARMDQIAWDLGNPAGTVKDFDQICQTFPVFGACEDFHPMKGPMVTQTLIGTGSSAPLHWRGDRTALAEFNPTFVDLQAADAQLTDDEMAEFVAFLATIRFPPNPYRNLDGTLKTTPLSNGGIPQSGAKEFDQCSGCHFPGQGFNAGVVVSAFRGDSQSFNTSHLRNMYEKTGFDKTSQNNNRGFGFLHDGHADTMFTLLQAAVFGPGGGSETFTNDAEGDQNRRHVEALMLSDVEPRHNDSTLPMVGHQIELVTGPPFDAGELAAYDEMLTIVNNEGKFAPVSIVAKGVIDNIKRGFSYRTADTFQSDRAGETHTAEEMKTIGGPGNLLTLTIVPSQNADRIGIDRDEDGFFDRDELDVCSNPADASITPGNITGGSGDVNSDGWTDGQDVGLFVDILVTGAFGLGDPPFCASDLNGDGNVNLTDAEMLVGRLLGTE
ncbi:MAG: hypothetical protein MI923_21180 [Phycisphaerales bacterium]|nr:hypothetical protein [Phycisphaerales bacterium]